MVRPRRGSSMLEICCGVRPGFSAVSVVEVIAAPGTRPPVVTLAGTTVGMVQKLDPSVWQLAAGHCAALKALGVPQPALPSSQPVVKILLCTPDRPIRAPKSPQVSLTIKVPRSPIAGDWL